MKTFLKAILGGLLSLFGFSSCNKIQNSMCMYGQPHAYFTVKGTVSDEEGKPIEGIRTIVDSYYKWSDDAGYDYSNVDYTDTLYTDAKGKIELTRSIFNKSRVVVTLTDVDGEENGGTFEELVLNDVEVERTEKGDDLWYNGAYEAKFKATMTRKD